MWEFALVVFTMPQGWGSDWHVNPLYIPTWPLLVTTVQAENTMLDVPMPPRATNSLQIPTKSPTLPRVGGGAA